MLVIVLAPVLKVLPQVLVLKILPLVVVILEELVLTGDTVAGDTGSSTDSTGTDTCYNSSTLIRFDFV